MIDPTHPIAQLVAEDRRYTFEAYVFLLEALAYAQNVLEMGEDRPTEPPPDAARRGRGTRPAAPRDRPAALRGHSALRAGSVRLHGKNGVEQLGAAQHE